MKQFVRALITGDIAPSLSISATSALQMDSTAYGNISEIH